MLEHFLRITYQICMGYFVKPVILESPKRVVNEFRCLPIDLDVFIHLNNAKYATVAELTRWRLMPAMGVFSKDSLLLRKGCIFLVGEQRIQYLKAIQPFQRYVVETKIEFNQSDDKWIWHTHTFLQHPYDIKPGKLPIKYAEVEVKVVVKEKSGKTVRPSELCKLNEFTRHIMISSEKSTFSSTNLPVSCIPLATAT